MKRLTARLLYFYTFLFLACLLAKPALAQEEATPSEELIKEKIKERLEESVTGKIKGLQEELEQKPKKKAFIGTIETIMSSSIVLNTDFGEREAIISPDAELFYYEPGGGQTEIEVSSLETQDYLVLMGILENDILDTQRVIKMPEPETQEDRELLFGEVSEIDDQEIEVTIQNGTIKRKETLEIDEETPLEFKDQAEASLEDIQIGDQLYAVVIKEEGEIIEVKRVLIIPGKNNPLSEENLQEATEAAEAGEASPTATP